MAVEGKKFINDFPFYQALQMFYEESKGKIKRNYKSITRKFLDFNDKKVNPNAFLRRPQFEALEMYIFIKEFLDNKRIYEIFDEWYKRSGVFSHRSYYAPTSLKSRQISMYDYNAEKYSTIFDFLKEQSSEYPNYIYALTMGLGKTILMATCIFYEFLLSFKFPNDKRFCHNVIVFAPDKTVLQSLKEIMTFDKSKVVPHEYLHILDSNISFYFLDDSSKTLNTIDGSNFNIIISNTQKIILKQRHTELSPSDKFFNMNNNEFTNLFGELYEDIEIKNDQDVIENQRFEKIKRLRQLGVYVDEAHHLFGTELKKSLTDTGSTSLRYTINELSKKLKENGTDLIACYNYTGTPYVDKSILPEVVSYCGLKEAINMEYLKYPIIHGFEAVKNEEFLTLVLKDFFNKHKNKTYEGLLPKIAIFGSTVTELINDVKPNVEKILTKLGVSIDKILVNVGDSKYTKDSDIFDFNNLDVIGTEGSRKQVILMVNKGREGWNCRSLFSVALYRSPNSKVFVLQSTMRCLRKITSVQQDADIYLSKENYKILDNELNKNFNITISDIPQKNNDKISVDVQINHPVRTLKIKEIKHIYELHEVTNHLPINFNLDSFDFSKYEAKVIEKQGISNNSIVFEKRINSQDLNNISYSKIQIVSEIARYLNMSCLTIEDLLLNCKDSLDKVLKTVSKYNDLLYDHIIPTIFHYFYNIETKIISKEKDVKILDYQDNGEPYKFKCSKELLINMYDSDVLKWNEKSFHTDNYCFDSKPEKIAFLKYLKSDNIKEVYFTGMFTGHHNGISVEYIDPVSNIVRTYYPDFIVKKLDGSYDLIEIKGDNKKDDEVVAAKAFAAMELAYESKMDYKFILASEALSKDISNL